VAMLSSRYYVSGVYYVTLNAVCAKYQITGDDLSCVMRFSLLLALSKRRERIERELPRRGRY